MKFQATIGDTPHEIEIDAEKNTFTGTEQSGNFHFELVNGRYILRTGTKTYKLDNVEYNGSEIRFSMNGVWHSVDVKDEQELLLDRLGFKTGAATAEGILKAPMPGKILELMVTEGDEVEKDQPLVILEAMKMENELKAPISGTITELSAETGDSLEKNSPILEIEPIG